jgi:sugar (pentulose or hexulose) kinase
MVETTIRLLADLVDQIPEARVEGIGVTGQQHGMTLLDREGRACGPFIGWQDRRSLEPMPSGQTFLSRMREIGGDHFLSSEYLPARGYLGTTLFWLAATGQLPAQTRAAFAPDVLAGRLCGRLPVTDPTNAAGSGVFNVLTGAWNEALIRLLGLSPDIFPVVHPSCVWIGGLSEEMARRAGLPSGLPVANACGDNQASFAGSVAGYNDAALVNIGTGGQISVFHPAPVRIEGLLARPFLKPGYLLVGAGLTGGRSYAVLERFIRLVGTQIFGLKELPDVYDRMNELAARISSGSDGLVCEPVFTGSLKEPERRGLWSGVSDANLTPGHVTRALLEGMAGQFYGMYRTLLEAGIQERRRFVGAGNGVRKNPLLSRILEETFGMPLHIVGHPEEAAFGAALCASVASGAFPDIEAAGAACIRYGRD